MDFTVTVRTYTGAVKSVDVKNMPNEDAARAEAVSTTFGRVLSVERTDIVEDVVSDTPKKKRRKLPEIERELMPGETETIVTGYNNNPLAVFSLLKDDGLL
jgi:hypothetical protein